VKLEISGVVEIAGLLGEVKIVALHRGALSGRGAERGRGREVHVTRLLQGWSGERVGGQARQICCPLKLRLSDFTEHFCQL
jgi:hypothetical protein